MFGSGRADHVPVHRGVMSLKYVEMGWGIYLLPPGVIWGGWGSPAGGVAQRVCALLEEADDFPVCASHNAAVAEGDDARVPP